MSDIRRRLSAILAALVLGLTMALPHAVPASALTIGELAIQVKAAASVSVVGTPVTAIYCGLVDGG
ncbi:hypothetical protein GA0111570_1361, partial [Raineyella antarctica]